MHCSWKKIFKSTNLPHSDLYVLCKTLMSPSLTLFRILWYRWNICFGDGVRIEPSRSMDLESLRDLSKDTIPSRENHLSPTTLATSKVAIYSYTYVDCATVHTHATSQTNHVLSQTTDFSYMRLLVVWELHHRNSLRQVDFHSHHKLENITSVLTRHWNIYLTFVHWSIQGSL